MLYLSSVTYRIARCKEAQTDLPIFGVVFPTAKRAAQVTKNGRVGIIATPATIRTGAYDRVIRAENPNVTLTARSC